LRKGKVKRGKSILTTRKTTGGTNIKSSPHGIWNPEAIRLVMHPLAAVTKHVDYRIVIQKATLKSDLLAAAHLLYLHTWFFL
jgi:hypothetical protein